MTERSPEEMLRVPGRDIERFGREYDGEGECALRGECEMELLAPWLEKEVLRERAEESSCDSERDCDSDLEWSDSVEAACRKKRRRPWAFS